MPATLTAPEDACGLLDADHVAVKHLFVEYARLAMASRTDSSPERAELARRICEELTVHARIEEEVVYPALRRAVPEIAALLDEARAENQEARDLIAQIEALATADREMDELVSQLACAVEHHVAQERDELFPKVRSARKLDLAALAEQIRERQQMLQAETT